MKELFLISFITVLGFAGVTKSGDIVTDNDTKLIWQDDNDTVNFAKVKKCYNK